MTDHTIEIAIAAVGMVAVQLLGMVLSYLRDRAKMVQIKEVRADLDRDMAQGKETAKVVDVIHTATNSDRAKMEAKLAEQADELKAIRAQVEAMHREATKKAEEKRA